MHHTVSRVRSGLAASTFLVAGLAFTQPALASSGCTAANAGAFDLSIPVGNPNQFGGSVMDTFAAGDVLRATTTGAPTGTQAFLSPGSLLIVNASFADVTGSATIPTAGTYTLTRTLSANVMNGGTLTFTCTPGPSVPATPTPTTPDDVVQSDTATNVTTISSFVENQTVGGIIDGVITTNPAPQAPDPALLAERRRLIDERNKLIDQEYDLRARIDQAERDLEEARTSLQSAEAQLEKEEDPDKRDALGNWGTHTMFIDRTVPIDINSASQYSLDRYIKRLEEFIETTEREMTENRAQLQITVAEKEAIKRDIRSLPEDPNYIPSPQAPNSDIDYDLDDLGSGDGESILFARPDPFVRALARYRGFKLDVAETGDSFATGTQPLSFTQTLDEKTVGWVRAIYTDYEQDDPSQQDGHDLLIAVGAHRDMTTNLRLGAFITAKWGDVTSPVNTLDIDSRGYSLGLYGRYKWGEIDLNATTRLGLTRNDIAVGGTTGSYDTRLASMTLGVSGQERLAENVWMQPAISTTLTWVNREDYVNSVGSNIGGNTTWSGNVSAGPTVGMDLTPPEGFTRLAPAIGLRATYRYSDQDSQAGSVTTSETDYLSLSLAPQLSMTMENGANLDLFGSYFGIGADLDGWSIGGTLSIPLN